MVAIFSVRYEREVTQHLELRTVSNDTIFQRFSSMNLLSSFGIYNVQFCIFEVTVLVPIVFFCLTDVV